MRLADVGDGVFVGDYEACDARGAEFDRTIHVWRETNRAEDRLCRHVRYSEHPGGLTVYWREGEPVGAMSVPFAEVVAYAAQPGRLLVHCAAGVCRSATIAVAAKVARGRNVYDAIAAVNCGLWSSYREPPWLVPAMMRGVLEWAESVPGK